MKEKPNYAELEKQIDFTALAGKLGQLSAGKGSSRERQERGQSQTLTQSENRPVLGIDTEAVVLALVETHKH